MPQIRNNLSVRATTYVTGDLTRPEVETDGDVAVYVEAIKMIVESTDLTITASVRSQCFDRFSGEAVAPCEGQYIETEQGNRETVGRSTLQQPGLSFKFPFGTEQQDYRFFDTQVRKAVKARYDGEDTVQGLDTYRYVIEVPNTKVGEREVPGSLVGEPDEQSVDASMYYQAKRTLWVEPVTGVIVLGEQEMTQELVPPGEEPGDGTVVFNGKLRLNDATVTDFVTRAEEGRGQVRLLTVGPVVLWVVGALLILLALFLLYGGFRRGEPNRVGEAPPMSRQPAGAA